jgi:hypothetical protein
MAKWGFSRGIAFAYEIGKQWGIKENFQTHPCPLGIPSLSRSSGEGGRRQAGRYLKT